MLSLLKRRSEAAAALSAPNWHPNFRNYEKLPDIKAVRTAFFVNGVSIVVAVSLLLYSGVKEWQLLAVNNQIGEEQRKIDRDKRPSEQAVTLFKKFQEQEARVLEVDSFVKSKPLVSALLMRLGETLPANVAIDTIDLRMDGMALRLSVRGDAVAASGYATQYLDQLKVDKELAYFGDFVFSGTPTRNPTTGRMAVEFFLRFKPAAAGGKK